MTFPKDWDHVIVRVRIYCFNTGVMETDIFKHTAADQGGGWSKGCLPFDTIKDERLNKLDFKINVSILKIWLTCSFLILSVTRKQK